MFSQKMNYHDYLEIDRLLSCQRLESDREGKPEHDEMLFIIVHQAYELWFKLMLTEFESVLKMLNSDHLDERLMDHVVSRLGRVVTVQKLLIQQVDVIETMTPLDFLEFRDLLIPASGFQSFQFRMLEIRMGLRRENRLKYNEADYDRSLKPGQRAAMLELEREPSLFDRFEKWLERTPFLKMRGFDFWQLYQDTVEKSLRQDLLIIEQNPTLGELDRARNRELLQRSLDSFRALFDEKSYEQSRAKGEWRLSHKAIHAALLIQLYRDQPALQLPFRLITALQDIDEHFTNWRHRHALMVKRMLGAKIGTGGSSGFQYLREATDQHRVFQDLFQLTTFFVPRSKLPPLPPELQRELSFTYSRPSNSSEV